MSQRETTILKAEDMPSPDAKSTGILVYFEFEFSNLQTIEKSISIIYDDGHLSVYKCSLIVWSLPKELMMSGRRWSAYMNGRIINLGF